MYVWPNSTQLIQMMLDQTPGFSSVNCLEQKTGLIFSGNVSEEHIDSTG